MEWVRVTANAVFVERLPVGIWLAALLASWGIAAAALAAGLGRGRRMVPALRRATVACAAELMGLGVLVFLENPERWRTVAWVLSLSPLALAVLAVGVAAWRGDELPRPATAGDLV